MISPLLLAALLAAPSRAQKTDEVRRGDIDQQVATIGTVQAVDIFRLKSTIEGRAEKVWTTTGVWADSDQTLAILLNKEFAAIADAHSSTSKDVLEDRWQAVYQPTHVRCPYPCYILKAFARSKAWVMPRAVLFEAAAHLRVTGRVRPEEAHLVRDGMTLEYWDVKHPEKHLHTKVAHYLLDVQGEKVTPGGTFWMDLTLGPEQSLPPGTDWEGVIVPSRKANVLLVPTASLIRFGDDVFLPVRVSTGITGSDWTEIAAGVESKRPILILGDDQLRQARRHRMEVDFAALHKRLDEQALPEGPPDAARPQPRHAEDVRDPDSNLGEDPYSE